MPGEKQNQGISMFFSDIDLHMNSNSLNFLNVYIFLRCSHSEGEERLESPFAKKLTDIGIRRIFSSEHDIFRESVRKFFQEEVVPYHTE